MQNPEQFIDLAIAAREASSLLRLLVPHVQACLPDDSSAVCVEALAHRAESVLEEAIAADTAEAYHAAGVKFEKLRCALEENMQSVHPQAVGDICFGLSKGAAALLRDAGIVSAQEPAHA